MVDQPLASSRSVPVPLCRRSFLQTAAACGLGLAGNWAIAAADEGENWSIPVLGDLHFDRLEHHDLEWLAREHPGDVRQVQNYSQITRERTPSLLARVRTACHDLQRERAHVPFVLQLGDLLEGLCGSEELALRQAREAIELVGQAKLPVPLLLTKGNHDISGPGAAAVYERALIPFMAGTTRTKVPQAAFSRTVGGTLLAFYDAYDRGSLDWFAGILEEQKPRRLIVAIHPPVVPFNARSTWHIYSAPKYQQQRARLLNLLGRHKAVVLCGHLHKYSLLVRRTDEGPFVQLAISSVASTKDGRTKNVLKRVQDYGPDLVDLEPQHSPDTLEARRAWLAVERPFIEHFEYAETWGHAAVSLCGNRAQAIVYRGLEDSSWKEIDLSQLLEA
jgi:hypothetical protein